MKIIEIIVGILSSIGFFKYLYHSALVGQQQYVTHQLYCQVAMINDLLWMFGCLIVLGFIVLKFDK